MSNAVQLTMSKSNIFGKHVILIVVFLFLLRLPQESYGFGFNFGADGGGDDMVAKTGRKAKFKFRKIERSFSDNTNLDGVKNDDAADDDIDDVSEGQRQSTEVDNSLLNEEEELKFERTRKVAKARRSSRKLKKTAKEENIYTWVSRLYEKVFNGVYEDNSKEDQNTDTNSIIFWLKWLGKKSRRWTSDENSSKEISLRESWTNYLNRWPFNSIFPFEKSQKTIGMSKKRLQKEEKITISSETAEPMSQENFESLLNTLPAFVLQPSNVVDIECRRQLQIFHRQLRSNKLWTLQMLDASGKISTGILHGNINQIGDFELCSRIKTLIKVTKDIPMRMRGKYCLAHIEIHTDVPELKTPLHLLRGRGLWNSHFGNPSHFLPRYTVANWGICIPQLCSANIVAEMVTDNLRSYNATGIEFHVEVDEDIDCYVHKSRKFFKLLQSDRKFCLSICLLGTLCGVVCAALLRENWRPISSYVQVVFQKLSRVENVPKENQDPIEEAEKQDEQFSKETQPPIMKEFPEKDCELPEMEDAKSQHSEDTQSRGSSEMLSFKELCLAIFQSFSPYRTFETLLSTQRLDVEFPVFHVLKIGATFMLYICLKFLMIGHIPVVNRDTLAYSFEQPLSILFRAPLIYTDTLLMISGFLSAYQLSKEMQEKKCIQVFKRFVAKMIRFLPTIYIVLIFHTWIQPNLGIGPFWNNLIGQNARICEQQMWRNVFNVQNTIDMEDTCSPMSIQLALEMQLYLLAPLTVWLYFTDSDAGFFVYGALQALSVAMRFSRTNREHLSIIFFHGMNVSKFYRTANMLYSSPITRATTYLLGIGAGILYRTQNGTLNIRKEIIPVGWAIAILSIIWNFWWPSSAMRSDFIYSSADAAAYAAWSPLIFGLALFWIIFMFPCKNNSILNFVTSSRPFYILSRTTFPMQLVMYVIVLHNTATIKDPQKFSIQDLVNINEIFAIIVFGILLAFIIDVPIQNIRHIIVARLFRERSHDGSEESHLSSADVSEADEISEAHTNAITSESPQPTESIWASDPEEEQKNTPARNSLDLSTNDSDLKGNSKKTEEEEEEEKEEEEEEEEE